MHISIDDINCLVWQASQPAPAEAAHAPSPSVPAAVTIRHLMALPEPKIAPRLSQPQVLPPTPIGSSSADASALHHAPQLAVPVPALRGRSSLSTSPQHALRTVTNNQSSADVTHASHASYGHRPAVPDEMVFESHHAQGEYDSGVSARQPPRRASVHDVTEAGSVYVHGGLKYTPKPQPQPERPSLSRASRPSGSEHGSAPVTTAMHADTASDRRRASAATLSDLDARMQAHALSQQNAQLAAALDVAEVCTMAVSVCCTIRSQGVCVLVVCCSFVEKGTGTSCCIHASLPVFG